MSIRREKIRFFEKGLTDFFRKTGRVELPWRKKRITAYEVWVSEIMLQQTQVVRVMEYYLRFIGRFPTVERLAEATWEEFLPYYQGLGYYARGRNMIKAAQKVVAEYDGKFPRDQRLLETLPGIGPYTAAAILSFAYGENHLAWDTNVKRVIGRFFFGGKQLVTDEDLWAERFTMKKREMNAALMDFGSALCVARPKCEACALRRHCRYYQEKGVGEVARTQKKSGNDARAVWRHAAVHVFLHENHRHYFSSRKSAFRPFILPSGYNTRAGIKQYFLKKYGLSLAVRPPHQRLLLHAKPVLLVNAQILLGEPVFAVFSKKAVEEYNGSTAQKLPAKKLRS